MTTPNKSTRVDEMARLRKGITLYLYEADNIRGLVSELNPADGLVITRPTIQSKGDLKIHVRLGQVNYVNA